MSTCARCGAAIARGQECEDSSTDFVSQTVLQVDCLRRELSNLRSLLRSVTISLEQAAGYCEAGESQRAGSLIDNVLERLS